MKEMIVVFLCGIIMLPYDLFSQEADGFEISGHVGGLSEGEMVKLGNTFEVPDIPTWIDSCKVINGAFHLRGGTIPESPRIYLVSCFPGPGQPDFRVPLFIDNGQKISIYSDRDGGLNIEGSPSTTFKNNLTPVFQKIGDDYGVIDRSLRRIHDSIGYERQLIGRQLEMYIVLEKKVDSIMSSLSVVCPTVSPFLVNALCNIRNGSYHPRFMAGLYNNLNNEAKASNEGKIFKERARLSVGQPFPEFELSDPTGHEISLKSSLSKARVTLIHFWATNSIDVERYQKELLFFYSQYHKKQLNVIGISADTSVDSWRSAIRHKKYPWVNVIADPRGWLEGSQVYDVYHEGGHVVPNTTNVLLDSKGLIIAWDVSGVVLQYYLETLIDK